MGKDYYATLDINRDADEATIARAYARYKKLALKWHPKLSKENPDLTYHKFCEISEAYEVLGDPHKRAFYDKYGEEKLKDGFLIDGNFKGGYRFGGNAEEIFENFFGNTNPFSHLIDDKGNSEMGTMFGFAFGGLNYKGPTSLPNLEVPVECTLSELYNGCTKHVTYTRTVLKPDGKTTKNIQETKSIEVKKGYGASTTIPYKGQGNEASGLPTSDLVFKIKELPHPNFKRKGDDLIYIAKVSLIDALCSEAVFLKSLDSRQLRVPVDQIITPTYTKFVPGEGMPIFNDKEFTAEGFNKPNKRGDLYIKFDIVFPKQLTEEQKEEIRNNLPSE